MKLTDAERTLAELIEIASPSFQTNEPVAQFLQSRLERLGFRVQRQQYRDERGVEKVNLVGVREPKHRPASAAPADTGAVQDLASRANGMAYSCHSDVVPVKRWSGPGGDGFRAVFTEDRIYGRGACDMKGSIAAMLSALEAFPLEQQLHPIWFLCTADEEVNLGGAKRLAEHSELLADAIDAQPFIVIGEPTGLQVVHAHKGMHGFRIVSEGRSVHSSSDRGLNATRAVVPVLKKLLALEDETKTRTQWQDARFHPPTLSLNYGVRDQAPAFNVVPGRCEVWGNVRTMPEVSQEVIFRELEAVATSSGLTFERVDGCDPMETPVDDEDVRSLCRLVEQAAPDTACYATDGSILSDLRRKVVLGPGHIAQAHTDDEYIHRDQLAKGQAINLKILKQWCGDESHGPSDLGPQPYRNRIG
ncbi:MAG: M20/M25/M40 family metallo-hydrolase [Planctomycetota bacterium]